MTTTIVDHYEVRYANGFRHRGEFDTYANAAQWLALSSPHWGYVYHVMGTGAHS